MSIKDRTRQELEERVQQLERIIARKGVGSEYLERAERIQRDINLALILGGAASILGLTAWLIYRSKGE